ncbi:MAG: GNAT family N-acetyltransferase [Burkholderiales bacterium]|nr:GNAT family N-acetyltransferase [Burkholderiales bacterium]
MFRHRIAYGTGGFPWKGSARGDSGVTYGPGLCPVAEDLHSRSFMGLAMGQFAPGAPEVTQIVDAFRKVWSQLRVGLPAMQAADITDTHLDWLNDTEVVRHSNQRFVHHTLDSSLRYWAGFEGSANLYVSVRLVLIDAAVGTLTAYRNLHHGTADIGILMGQRGVWGQGLGLEAFSLLAD